MQGLGGFMRVKVSMFGIVDVEEIDKDGFMEVKEHATIEQVLKQLPLDKQLRKHAPVTVNGRFEERSYQLSEGDELALIVPTSGG
jgi:molybdopterin converting factor small subunit